MPRLSFLAIKVPEQRLALTLLISPIVMLFYEPSALDSDPIKEGFGYGRDDHGSCPYEVKFAKEESN
ncbi:MULTISPECIES: hypothetical protein [unclassified Cytobacillus]|uniref:hypothetical protein n=1 Tax=unclassified Cytobacillus TaxID=2675268 RepID=UPI00203CEA83|nr:hypothetical protein [Cytobacillus sp. AMY 15.2]MCM3092752.1 hypothetical protein [Cytobacillus sp. AMY 15.2]